MPKRVLRKFLSGLAVTLLLAGTIGGGLLLLSPTIPLSFLTQPVSWLLSRVTGHEQQVQGRFYLIPGRWTEFIAEEAAVTYHWGSEASLQTDITSCRVRLQLWPAMTGNLIFDVLEAGGVRVDLTTGISSDPEEVGRSELPDRSIAPVSPIQANRIDLNDITIRVTRPSAGPLPDIHVMRARGSFTRTDAARLLVEARVDNHEFRGTLNGSPLRLLEEPGRPWEFSAEIGYRTIRAQLEGELIGAGPEANVVAGLRIFGERASDLSNLAGASLFSDLPFSLRGGVELSPGRLEATLTEFSPGTRGLEISMVASGDDVRTAHYEIKLTSGLVDLDALKTLLSGGAAVKGNRNGRDVRRQITPEDQLFPEHIPSVGVGLSLDIDRLVMAGRTITGIHLRAKIRERRLEAAPFEATFTNLRGSGQLVIDLNQEEPQIAIALQTSGIDIEGILKELGLVGEEQFLSMHLASSKTTMAAGGRTLAALRRSLHLEIEARDGLYRYQDPNTGAELPIDLVYSRLAFNAGEHFSVQLDGRVHDIPVAMALSIDDRQNLPWARLERLPLNLVVNTAGTTWELDGYVPIPLSLSGVTLNSRLYGEQLSDLNELLDLVLPELGPYELAGNFSRTSQGYRFDGLNVRVGDSSLSGHIVVDTSKSPPALDVELVSPRVQLDDFKGLLRSTAEAQPQLELKEDSDNPAEDNESTPSEVEETRRFLTDQEVLDSYDASVRVEVAEVLSGRDFLGSGELQIEQSAGRLRVDPVVLHIPGGKIELDLLQEPAGTDRFYRINMVIEDFDYGIIGRRIRPDTDVAGMVNLRATLEAQSPDLEGIMEGSSGYLNLSVHPEQLRTGLVDLWAVNLLSFLFSFLTEESDSKINCLAGSFRLEGGKLSEEQLLIDTSRIQVKGTVKIDFGGKTIRSFLRPIPKRPQFFSLATPIEIHGSFDNLGVSLPPSGIVGTIARVATSYIVVPIQWIIMNRLPVDGTEHCLQIYRDWPDSAGNEK